MKIEQQPRISAARIKYRPSVYSSIIFNASIRYSSVATHANHGDVLLDSDYCNCEPSRVKVIIYKCSYSLLYSKSY